jgi:hypothetical protein
VTEPLLALHRQYPFISWAVAYTCALLAIALGGLALDARLVAGINPWIKPIKFQVSIVIFLLTVGWLLMVLDGSPGVKRIVAGGAALAMAVEITAIVIQAARGVGSHFNSATPFDGSVFALMGIMIAINTVLVVVLLVLYCRPQPHLPPAVLWGIRLGIFVFLLASVQGTLLLRNQGHTVGAPDGGSGLFFLNWSTQYGDLRVAHFLGMHGIQILPGAGWLLSRSDRGAGVGIVVALFAVLVGAFAWSLREALSGRPLLRM